MSILPIEQRLSTISRIAKTLSWDEVERAEIQDGWNIRYRPAGQIKHPESINAAITQLGYALAPYQTRMTEYLSSSEGGPRITMFVPTNPMLIGVRS
jgi:hypothetical protein